MKTPLKLNREERLLREKEERERIINEYSQIVEEFPENLKEFLTSRMGSMVITPRDSFLAYFKDSKTKYDLNTFRIKFIERFTNIEPKILKLIGGKKKDGTAIDKFWSEFEVLFLEVPNSKGPVHKLGLRRICNAFTAVARLGAALRRLIFFF